MIRKYQDVSKNEVKFLGKITVEADNKGIRKMHMLVSEREDMKPLHAMDWRPEFNWTIRNFERATSGTDQLENKILNILKSSSKRTEQ